MRSPLKIIAPLVIATGLPLVGAGVASATVLSITSCSMTPATASLAPGESQNITIGWEDGVNTPGALDSAGWQEMIVDGVVIQGLGSNLGTAGGNNPETVSFTFDMLSSALAGQAGTVKFSYYATDGSAKVGSELCSFTASVAAVGSTTTTTVVPTTVPTTLPQTGSNTGTMLAGGAMIAAFGGALYLSGRRRSVK